MVVLAVVELGMVEVLVEEGNGRMYFCICKIRV